MTRTDVVVVALALAAAVLLIGAGIRLLRWSIRVLPLEAHRRKRARRWLPAMQVLVAIALISLVALLAAGPAGAGAAAVAAAVLVTAAAWFAIRDVIAGVVLRAEHGFEAYQTIRAGDFTGRISRVGARSLEMETAEGRRVRVPYGRLGGLPVDLAGIEESGRPLQFTVALAAADVAHLQVDAIRRAALHSFFASACRVPHVRVATDDTGARTGVVTVYAAEAAFLPAIEAAVRDTTKPRA